MLRNLPTGVKFLYGVKKERGPKGGRTSIQSILFDKAKWSVEKAKDWLSDHNFLYGKVDEGKDYLRFRQQEPKGFIRYRTINPPELAEQYLRRAVIAATKYYDDPDDLLNELQTTLEDIVYTVFESVEGVK